MYKIFSNNVGYFLKTLASVTEYFTLLVRGMFILLLALVTLGLFVLLQPSINSQSYSLIWMPAILISAQKYSVWVGYEASKNLFMGLFFLKTSFWAGSSINLW